MSQLAIPEGWYAIHAEPKGNFGIRSRAINRIHYFFNGEPLCSNVEWDASYNKVVKADHKKKCGHCSKIKDTYSDLSNYVYKQKK